MKEYYIEVKEKKIQENGNYFISIICFLIQKRGLGGRAGYILAKEIRDKKISDWKTHSRSIDFQFKISRENRVTDAYYFNLVCFCRRAV